jgi:hypothetical protein
MTCSGIGIAKDDVRGGTEKTEKELDQLKSLTVENEMLPVDQSADLPPLCVPSVNDLSCACQTASVRSC